MNTRDVFNILITVVGSMILGAASLKLYDKWTTWTPSETTTPMVFLHTDPKTKQQLPLIQMDNRGVLSIDLSASYKAWQEDSKREAKKEKK